LKLTLISNLKLNYVTSYDPHPFPEYLRTGIPVALSTDDRGMWDSNMTDEFFVAVNEFGLTWQEIIKLSENSIQYGFLSTTEKASLLDKYKSNMKAFTTITLRDEYQHEISTSNNDDFNFIVYRQQST
jgi:adenosine deaminase CECR1